MLLSTQRQAVRRAACGAPPRLTRQARTAVETRGQASLEDELMGKGLWGDESLPAGLPKTAFWGKFDVPRFDYVRKRKQGDGITIGIDLGTTNSCVTYMDPDSNLPVVVPIKDKKTTPTVIGLARDNARYFGHEAYDLAHRNSGGLSMCSGKRLLGKALHDRKTPRQVYEDVVDLTMTKEMGVALRITSSIEKPMTTAEIHNNVAQPVTYFTLEYPVVHIIAMFLRYLKTETEDLLGKNVDVACITVPAHFSKAQRKATEDAAIVAGLDVAEILDEPSAAALAYRELVAETNFATKDSGRVVVFDLGGGTFDIAVLEMDFVNKGSRVIASGGDDLLGGDDFDRILIEYWVREIREMEVDPQMHQTYESALRKAAAEAKHALDTAEEYTTQVTLFKTPMHIAAIPLTITRFEYEELVNPLLERMGECVKEIFAEAGMDTHDVDDVLLVGEMTRTPCIQDYVEKTFGKKPVFSDVASPGTVVAAGAALRGYQLARIEAGDQEEHFVYDKNSVQYRKQLSGFAALSWDVQEWLRERRERKKLGRSLSRIREHERLVKGLSDENIAKLSREIIVTEMRMSKEAMCKRVGKEATALLQDVKGWKEPRQGFQDKELDELLEVLKFWLRVVDQQRTSEEQLAQALWECKFYFEELAGTSEMTQMEKMRADPEVQGRLGSIETQKAKPGRTFTRKKKAEEEEAPSAASATSSAEQPPSTASSA